MLSSAPSCASTRVSRDRKRWLILLEEIISYPEMCAEYGIPRSTSAPASSLSTFFIIFFCKYASASSTGRSSAVLKFCTFLIS